MRNLRKLEQSPNLTDMFDNPLKIGLDEDLIKKAYATNKNYLHWDDLKFRTDNDDSRKKLWILMKLLRKNNLRTIKIGNYEMKYTSTSNFEKSLHEIDKETASTLELQLPSVKDMKKYVVNSLMEEAIAFSQLEGAVVTRTDAKNVKIWK